MAKISTVLGLYSHISAPINVKFGTGERTFIGQRVASVGQKTYFWTTE